jgi:hypothetical protein
VAQLVAQVVERDGGICWLCGKPGATSADHVVRVPHGGRDKLGNLGATRPSSGIVGASVIPTSEVVGNAGRRRVAHPLPQRGIATNPRTTKAPRLQGFPKCAREDSNL